MEKPESYNFHPESLLQSMVEFMARLSKDGNTFSAALAQEPNFSAPTLRSALARLSGVPSCGYGLVQCVEALISQVAYLLSPCPARLPIVGLS